MYDLALNQSELRGGQRVSNALCVQAAACVWRGLRLKGTVPVSVAFVDEREIRRLNKQYRGKDKVTDVLSFGAEKPDGSGEILICYAQARRQAKELRHSAREEILFLLVHGLLHLSGLDHETPTDAERMFPLQAKLLTRLGVDPRL